MTPPWVEPYAAPPVRGSTELGDRLDARRWPTPTSAPPGLPAGRASSGPAVAADARRARRCSAGPVLLAVHGRLQDADTPAVGGVALALVLLVGGLVLGLLLGLVCRLLVAPDGPAPGRPADERLRDGGHEVSQELVVEPVEAELAAYAAVRDGLGHARWAA